MLDKIMTKDLIIGNVNDSIYEISLLMKKYDIGFIPIAYKDKIKGVITDRDITTKIIANKENITNKIENYITKKIISIDVNNSIDDALNIMKQEKIKRLIVNDNKKVVGIISLSDIINNYNNDKKIISTIKDIYIIKNNQSQMDIEINDFYL